MAKPPQDGAVPLAKDGRTKRRGHMPKITLSYRRGDAAADAGRIFDRLSAHYGPSSVFMDIDTIPYGADFRKHIDSALRDTDVVLVIIGPKWIGRRGANVRIQDETDPVRIEVEGAMRLEKVIVPVLVANASMPKPSDLPPSIESLSFLNAAEIDSGKDFHANLDRLIRFIDTLPASSRANEGTQQTRVAAATIAVPAPRRWSWGASFLWIFWVFPNGGAGLKATALVLVALFFVGRALGAVAASAAWLLIAIYLGINGSRIMAANRRFSTPEQHAAVQQAWDRLGLGTFVVFAGAVAVIMLTVWHR